MELEEAAEMVRHFETALFEMGFEKIPMSQTAVCCIHCGGMVYANATNQTRLDTHVGVCPGRKWRRCN